MNDRTTSWSPSGGADASPRTGRMPAAGETLAGRFLLRRVLGTGGSGVVFAAHDIRLGQPVAIKVLHPGRIDIRSLERLRREVRAARTAHPNMAAVYDLHEADGLYFLSMELVEGESLRERLKREHKLPLDETIRIGAQVASALAHLHAHGIVHRDVKPGNILLTPGGDAKLCDMGLARPMEQGMTITETAMVVGTPAYMAPEQATGEELTPAADVYALGLTLYQMLAGEPPLVEATALSTLARRQKRRPPSVRREAAGSPPWLARLLGRMLDPNPRERPTAAQAERALAAGRFPFRPRRRTVVAAAALGLLATAGPLVYTSLRHAATVRFQVAGQEVQGVDAGGRITWRYPIGPGAVSTVRADIDGDGRDELALVTKDTDSPRAEVAESAGVMVFDLKGRLLTSARLRDIIHQWSFPYPLLLQTKLQAADLDLDGRSELVLLSGQLHFYPCELLIYWPARRTWQTVLENPGQLRMLTAIPGTDHPAVRFAGMSNRPVFVPVAGQITLDPAALGTFSPERRSRLQPDVRSVTGAHLDWYTLLDPSRKGLMGNTSKITVLKDGGTLIQGSDGRTLSLDRWGNPASGPNAGRDLRSARCAFLNSLAGLVQYTEAADPGSVRRLADRVRTDAALLLRETPYRLALDVTEARSLARAGDPDDAIVLLRATVRDTRNDDAVFRLAHLLGVTGRLREAVAVMEPAVATPASQRANFDCRLLLYRLAVELRDRPLARRCLLLHAGGIFDKAQSEAVTAAILARAHLWWDELTASDCRVRSWAYEPAGAALACLARWRLGRTVPDDPKLMHQDARHNPDAVFDFRLAEAAADLGLGRATDALGILDATQPSLRRAAADDFGDHQLLDLARALHATALLAAGKPSAARTEARALLPTLTPDLLPARLAGEVLEATGSSTALSRP